MDKLVKANQNNIKSVPACIVCNNNQARAKYMYYYGNNISEILECCKCGHLFISPPALVNLKERGMDVGILEGELFNSNIMKFLYSKIVLFREIKSVKKIIDMRQKPRLLDIGCGTGWVTSIWRDFGFVVTGLESSALRSQICRERYSLNVVTASVEEFNSADKFDVITMRHVLEHIENPVRLLRKLKSMIKDYGVLLITIPNINSVGRYIFKENWTWVLPWHLHFYSPGNLTSLLERNGFKKVLLYKMHSPLWYPDSLMKLFENRITIRKMLNLLPRIFLMFLFLPIIIVGCFLNLSDNITLIAKKKSPELPLAV
jgi:SAM-dependent methyltransferase